RLRVQPKASRLIAKLSPRRLVERCGSQLMRRTTESPTALNNYVVPVRKSHLPDSPFDLCTLNDELSNAFNSSSGNKLLQSLSSLRAKARPHIHNCQPATSRYSLERDPFRQMSIDEIAYFIRTYEVAAHCVFQLSSQHLYV